MRLLLSLVSLAGIAVPSVAQTQSAPVHLVVRFEILSADSTRPVTARVRQTGNALYSLGATRVPGRVVLSSDTGSVTTPGLLEVADGAGTISFETVRGDPEVVVVAAASPGAHLQLYGRGHFVQVARDSSGRLTVMAPPLRNRDH